MLEETREQPDGYLQIATRLGFINPDQVSRIIEKADSESISFLDAARSLDLLRAIQCEIIDHMLNPDQLAPGYTIRDLIGHGGNGIVFQATQTRLNRDVALKTINTSTQSGSQSSERMQREAHSIARLQHPNIVAAYDCGFHQGNFYIAMELVAGEDLASYCRRTGKVDEATAWWIARQVASALSHAHQDGVIHRDIKPANILLTETPEGSQIPTGVPLAKVVDFGLAFHSKLPSDSKLTEPGTTLGTPAFVAPEQLSDTHVDHRADIYSLGATVYQMLQATAPYNSKSAMKVIIEKTIGKDGWRDELRFEMSEATTQLFRDMTEADPERRPGSYETLLSRMDEVLGGLASPISNVVQTINFDDDILSNHDTKKIPYVAENTVTATTALATKTEPGRSHRTPLAQLAIAGLVVALLGGTAFVYQRQSASTKSAQLNSAARNWQSSGAPEYFFNGQSVPLRLRKSGAWSPEKGPEGESILRGSEGAWMDLPMEMKSGARDLRMIVAVAISDDAEADLRLPKGTRDEGTVLRMTSTEATLLAEDTEKPLSNTRAIGFDRNAEANQFHDCHFLAIDEMIVVLIDGNVLGSVPYSAKPGDTVRIGIRKKTADFADLRISEVRDKRIDP